MSAAVKALGVLAATVHVLDPVERDPIVLTPGTEVTDPDVAEQITNPACWETEPAARPKTTRKTT
ncbi:hypothetical protein ACFW6V_28465 [Streptomyces sp. NPDC058734]|uniref:hypothetical protein n=1 Tax=Streptomyces sp. NPDC058734 TaxID=3346615 RepID=UPI0036805CEB